MTPPQQTALTPQPWSAARRITAASLTTWTALTACASPEAGGHCDGVIAQAASAPGRMLLGSAAPYSADGTLRGREEQLRASQLLRRQAAWQIVKKVLAPVPLAEPVPGVPGGVVPAWQTWYGKDDLGRLFHHLYPALSAERRRGHDRFFDEELDHALQWNLTAVSEMGAWPAERLTEYVESIDSAEAVAGIAGLGRVGYSPSAARHLLTSYPEIVACDDAEPAPAFADGPTTGTRRLVRERTEIAACGQALLGPFFVDSGAKLVASTTAGTLSLRSANDEELCTAGAERACSASGGAAITVVIDADDAPIRPTVTVDLVEANPIWASCLAAPFPLDSVVVKADWRRVFPDQPLPVFDTSAAALTAVLGSAEVAWSPRETGAAPGPDEIYTAASDDQLYRLAALHLMTKELDHWMWVTLWWSPEPDGDFGADRPDDLAGVWAHYKMCAVSAFAEGDPDPSGGFSDPTDLGAALAVAHGGTGAPTWCSNPYLEEGHGNAATNCIGCHQHGSTGITTEDILTEEFIFPDHGRTQLRNNFPADYSWALDSGDRLGRLFADEVDYWK